MLCLATIPITLSLTVPAISVELFRYRSAAKDGSAFAGGFTTYTVNGQTYTRYNYSGTGYSTITGPTALTPRATRSQEASTRTGRSTLVTTTTATTEMVGKLDMDSPGQ